MKCLELLLEHGADINIKSKYGNTALHRAAVAGHADCLNLLIDRGIGMDIMNSDNATALGIIIYIIIIIIIIKI